MLYPRTALANATMWTFDAPARRNADAAAFAVAPLV